MLTNEKITTVQALVGDVPESSNTELIKVYLADAEDAILNRMYPFKRPTTPSIARYERIQCKLAARYILRRGAEGETIHNENGINRTYDSVNDEDLLSEVMQVVI